FIAVPERELGQGILRRAQLVKSIARAIRNKVPTSSLHVLGCGNLLSFALLSTAGASMCDGLEWCRTYAAENFHLHHFQHKELFVDAARYSTNPAVDVILSEDVPYPVAAASRNLLNFQKFATELQSHLAAGSVPDFVEQLYGHTAGLAVRRIQS